MIEHLKKSKGGFTLVELIVVIAILAILSGIAVPVYSGYISKANEAGDLQLLGALNTAYTAACAEMGLDPTKVVGLATLSGEAGSKTVSNVTASGSGAVALSGSSEQFFDAFKRYYGDNINTPFKVYESLGYDMANGVFVDGAKEVTVMYNGKPVTVTMAQITAYQASTYGEMGSDTVLDEVNHVVNAAKAALSQLSDPNNPAYAEYRAELESFLQDNYGIGLDGLNDVQRANALVLMVASKAKNFNASELVEDFNTTGQMSALLPDLDTLSSGDYSTALGDMATANTIPYAMCLAYVNSGMAAQDIATGKSERHTFASEEEALAAAAEDGVAADKIKYRNGVWSYTTPQTLDAKDFFYNGASWGVNTTLSNGARLSSSTIKGANNMTSADDVADIINVITNSDGFKSYMQSGQGEQDLNAFFSAMTMLSDNAGNIDTNDLLTNGFGDDELQAMVAAILGG